MTIKTTLASAFFLSATLSSHAVIVWNGGAATDDFYDDANWDFGGSSSASVTEPTDDDITITGATIDEPSAAFSNIDIGDGFSVTLDNTSFTFSNGNGFTGVNDVGDVTSVLNLFNGSSMSAQFAAVGITINVDATSILTFRGGGDPINSQTEKTTINLAPGAQLILPSAAEFTEQGVDIVVGGVSFFDDPSILNLNGATATAVIPEPSSILLSGIAGLGLLLRRRR